MSNIFDIDNWREIGATLARNKTRTFLTAFGIFWGTAMLALLWGAGTGIKGMLYSNFEGFATNCAGLGSGRTTKPYKGFRKGTTWVLNTDDILNLRRNIPELAIVSPMYNTTGTFKSKNKTSTGQVQGLEPNYVDVLAPDILSGRFINDFDNANSSRVCVVGKNVASTLFVDVDPLGQTVQIDNVTFRVVGTVKQKNDVSLMGRIDDAIIIPLSTMRSAYNLGNKVGFAMLVAKDGVAPGSLKEEIFSTIRKNHPMIHPEDEDCFFFFDLSEMIGQMTSVFTAFDFLLLFVGLSSLIAGIIGVGNIMWIVVKERTQEFGVRRAIGAKPTTIMWQILCESTVLTTVAGMAGICFGVFLLETIGPALTASMEMGHSDNFFFLSFWEAVTILVLFLVLGGAAGMIPAFRAMKIKPIEALNDK